MSCCTPSAWFLTGLSVPGGVQNVPNGWCRPPVLLAVLVRLVCWLLEGLFPLPVPDAVPLFLPERKALHPLTLFGEGYLL